MKTDDDSKIRAENEKREVLKDRKESRTQLFKASVNIFVDSSSRKKEVLNALLELDNIKEVYDVKGEFDIVSIVSASSVEEFSEVLRKKIMKIKGVKSTITSIFLKTYKQPEILAGSIYR